MRVAVLGLGEAGGRIAADLAAAGCDVCGFDPVARAGVVVTAPNAVAAVTDAEVVVSINAASVAADVARDVAAALASSAIYADFNTASPALKRELSAIVSVPFVDVALVGVVPATGLATPSLASGPAAARFAELFGPLGMPIEVVGQEPGDAAALKLLRSVFMKGVAAAAIESLEAARAAGADDRLRADIAAVLGEELLARLLSGSQAHATRRADEMRAAAEYVEELGVPPRIASAAAEWLEQLRDDERKQ